MRLTRRIGYALMFILILGELVILQYSFAGQQEKFPNIFIELCNQCHPLDRVLSVFKTKTGWGNTVSRMKKRIVTEKEIIYDKPIKRISTKDAETIINYLVERNGLPQIPATETGEVLFEKFCTQCHSPQRIFNVLRTKNKWTDIVSKMVKKMDALTISKNETILYTVSLEGARKIVNYLSLEKRVNVIDDTEPPKILFELFCSQCHSLQRAYSIPRSKSGWQKVVDRMVKKTSTVTTNRNGEPIVAINTKGADKIIAYLVSVKKKQILDNTESIDVLFEQFCSQCHSLKRVYSVHRQRSRWKKLVETMMQKADSSFSASGNKSVKQISKENADKLVEYLYQKLGASIYEDINDEIE